MTLSFNRIRKTLADLLCGDTTHDCVARYVFRDNGARTNNGPSPDTDASKYDCAVANPNIFLDDCLRYSGTFGRPDRYSWLVNGMIGPLNGDLMGKACVGSDAGPSTDTTSPPDIAEWSRDEVSRNMTVAPKIER